MGKRKGKKGDGALRDFFLYFLDVLIYVPRLIFNFIKSFF